MENAEDWAAYKVERRAVSVLQAFGQQIGATSPGRVTSGVDRTDDQTIRISIRPGYCPAVTWRSSGLSLATALRMTSAAMNSTSLMQP